MSTGRIINKETGEYQIVEYYTKEEKAQRKKWFDDKITREKHYTQPAESRFFRTFINKFNKIDDLDSQSATRLMYLATYMSYHDNFLKYDNSNEYMNKKDIIKVMGLAERASRNFFNEMISKGYLIEENGNFKITDKLFTRGSVVNDQNLENDRFTKIYIQALRTMYKSVNPKQHKFLGYVFQLLPFINIHHNIICTNPFEPNEKYIKAVNIIQLVKMLNMSPDSTNHFREMIEKVVFNFDNTQQHFLCYVLGAEDKSKNQGIILVNPNILYSGNDLNRQEVLKSFYVKDKEMQKIINQEVKEIAENRRKRKQARLNSK